jgi:hypothetical protein
VTEEQDQQQVDVRLHWEEGGRRRDQSQDSVSVGEAEDEQAHSQELEEAEELLPDSGPDEFQWDADREQALLDALEDTIEGTSPLVHQYIEMVMTGLKAETMSKDEARAALSEIEAYLADNIEWEQSKHPVDDEDFMQSRKDKLNALFAWREASAALGEYLKNGEVVQLKVASYAAEQGRSFLEQSLDLLLSCEPEEEEWDDEDDERVDDEDDRSIEPEVSG